MNEPINPSMGFRSLDDYLLWSAIECLKDAFLKREDLSFWIGYVQQVYTGGKIETI